MLPNQQSSSTGGFIPDEMPRVPSDSSTRRKMRKGTHSCFECRRRKIRCIFTADNPKVCTECFARGSQCVDQEHADSDVIVDQRKNLRERVARLEALVDGLLEDKQSPSPAKEKEPRRPGQSLLPPTPISSEASSSVPVVPENNPVMTMFDNAIFSRAGSESTASGKDRSDHGGGCYATPASRTVPEYRRAETPFAGIDPEDDEALASTVMKDRKERTRKVLMQHLPKRDRMYQIMNQNQEWWITWRHKCSGTWKNDESLPSFADRALRSENPVLIGILLICIGISAETNILDKYLALVDHHITSVDEFAVTLEGMECILLQSKVYADIGQPRRAWLCFRRAATYCQLIGLHRNHTQSQTHESLWWAIYSGDRFLSLMLGLPYSINDAHCNLDIRKDSLPQAQYLARLSRVGGQVIDRTQGLKEQSFPAALEIDQELDSIASLLPPSFWDSTSTSIDATLSVADMRERLLSQMCFHQIRAYLHLPFMLKSTSNPRFEYSSNVCFNSARELLRSYHVLRGTTGQPLYECKAIDFIAFTASILVLLNLLGYGRMSPVHNSQRDEADWRLIEISMGIFQRASNEKGGKVAAQSYKVLEQISSIRNDDCNKAQDGSETTKIFIPYFGTITIRRGNKFNHQPITQPEQQSGFATPQSGGFGSAFSMPQASQGLADDQCLAYDGVYLPHDTSYDQTMHLGDDSLGFMSGGNNLPWDSAAEMDIDRDWNWFFNDLQKQQQPFTPLATPQQQQQQQQASMF
ncbi:hypothetical protein BDY21DRAFT_345984 [Lineolata rhizophorae]|uniref:Zn(2)-C6 fungal-type domain-containing protein n=1 Tax=Lineolata rhizophorae TaxID=578093 RepID=A0A6A6NZV5_9PEZI|nr:hypothetical protein BDY21DRAFT_345984 [Lineolata rhizophorae]